ncbi:MAG: helix-turn-helix transcriptional regulator [Candidatus Omnitrophica bacterium]|nr:helix-turn-helix transcriptional regulator [Candidatus Omnitrophota bacterium]
MAVNVEDERQKATGQKEKRDGSLPLFYTIEIAINLKELDPKYPKDPKTLGERIRKARMDQHLMVKELAERVGVVPETVINWEKRNLKPTRKLGAVAIGAWAGWGSCGTKPRQSSEPELTVETAILDCFRDMFRENLV